jgi:hypothetical protein
VPFRFISRTVVKCLLGATAYVAVSGPAALLSSSFAQSAPPLRGSDADVPITAADPLAQPVIGFDAPNGGLIDTSDDINYGRPKPKPPKLYTPKPKTLTPNTRVSPPLPPLTTYPTAPGTRARAGNQAPADPATQPAPTIATTQPLPLAKKPKPDPAPFDPIGIGADSLRLFPFVETGIGYDTNPNRLANGVKASPYWRSDAGVTMNSNWSEHSLTADLHGGYSDYFQNHDADRPNGVGKITGRIDVTRDTQVDLDTHFTLDTQQPGSPQLAVPGSVLIVNRPLIETFGGSVGVTERLNRLSLSLRGTFDRYQYQNGLNSDGSTYLLSENNYNDYGITGRAAYELKPGLIPFVEITGDTRHHDQLLDTSGYDRNSNGLSGRAGSTFEFSRLLTGEIAAGYANRNYADARLGTLNGPTIDGSLIWTATPLTTLSFKAATNLVETTYPGATGALSHQVSFELAHALFRNFTLTGFGSYTNNLYEGAPITENLYSAGLRGEYKLTRSISIKASFTHERFMSTLSGIDYTANVFLLGLRLQQ